VPSALGVSQAVMSEANVTMNPNRTASPQAGRRPALRPRGAPKNEVTCN
jgi:hypothetical protein